ncbi:MAG: FmdB family zinc ribbon protein [Methylococcaceae bacterium]
MPIYEYQCKSCGHTLETIQKLSDEPLKDCPACGTPQLTKLVSAAGFRLKGGGWYETDFKTDKDKKKNLVGAATETKTETPKTEAAATPAASAPSTDSSG